MIGRTNVGGGGSLFSATLQVATDPNAVITAVNLAGDTFSGTADNSGALNLTITEPGTYTVTETDGGVESIAIADNGETYTLVVTAGTLIRNGSAIATFEAVGYSYLNYSSLAPTVTSEQYADEDAIRVVESMGNYSGMYRTTKTYSISGFSSLVFRGCAVNGSSNYLLIMDEDGNTYNYGTIPATSYSVPIAEQSYSLSGLDTTKEYRFGLWCIGYCNSYITDLRLE